jgi:hypothetical protein
MSQTRIAVVIGSLRKDSFNRKLALAIANLAPSDFTFEHLQIDDLPLYNQDHDATILGRVTLGQGAVIGGNVWITDDVPPGASVSQASLQNAPKTRPA